MRLALALLVLVAAPAAAQAPDPTRADSVAIDSVATGALAAEAQAPVPVAAAPPRPLGPTRHAYGRSGLVVTLPPGWTAPPLADESRLPQLARYTARQTDPMQPLAGTVLVVERVVGLNPLDRERWRVGQARYGYHGLRPVGPAESPLPALVALETAGPGTGGVTAFLQRGATFWTVAVQAPAALWQTRRAEILALMAGVAIP